MKRAEEIAKKKLMSLMRPVELDALQHNPGGSPLWSVWAIRHLPNCQRMAMQIRIYQSYDTTLAMNWQYYKYEGGHIWNRSSCAVPTPQAGTVWYKIPAWDQAMTRYLYFRSARYYWRYHANGYGWQRLIIPPSDMPQPIMDFLKPRRKR